MLILDLNSPLEQEELGERLAKALPAAGAVGIVIYLEGDLGTGKTTLVRGFLRGLSYAGKVKSPTYTLVEPYQIRNRTVLHMDLYRLQNPQEFDYLGLDEFISPNTVWLIEWPELGSGYLPNWDLRIKITYKNLGRQLTITSGTPYGDNMLKFR